MGREDIEKVRTVSRGKNGDLWTKWWGEAARKTVGRRLFKSLPLTGLDERDTRILEAADAEIDFDRQTGEVRQPQSAPAEQVTGTPRRPRVFDAVATQSQNATQAAQEPAEQLAGDAPTSESDF
jgi:recombinational DNA repair protein RecT